MKSQRRLKRRLFFVEELETRVVPSTVATAISSNWAGYAVTAASGAVAAVSGNWTVPTVTGRGTSYSSAWVGIDGFSSPTVEQVGTEQDLVNGVPQYAAWYEMYPSYPVYLPGTVKAGDSISASVTAASSGSFTLAIKDTSESWSYSTTQSLPSAQRSSAEWIVEAPSSGSGVLPLANFGSVSFTQASVTLGQTASAIDGSSSGQTYAINLVQGNGTQATTSVLSDSGTPATSSFTVSYQAAPSTGTGSGTSSGSGTRPHRHHRGQTNVAVTAPATPTAPAATATSAATAAAAQQALLPVVLTTLQPATPPAAVPLSATVVSPALPPVAGQGAGALHGVSLAASYPDGGGTDQSVPADLPADATATPDGRAMPEPGPDGNPAPAPGAEPAAPKVPAPAPMPAPDDLPADRQVAGAAWGWARDALFADPHWALKAPAAAAVPVLGRVGEEGPAAVPAAALALALGSGWRVTAEETEIRRRRWKDGIRY